MHQRKKSSALYKQLTFFVALLVVAWCSGESVGMRAAAVGGGPMALFQYYRRQRLYVKMLSGVAS